MDPNPIVTARVMLSKTPSYSRALRIFGRHLSVSKVELVGTYLDTELDCQYRSPTFYNFIFIFLSTYVSF